MCQVRNTELFFLPRVKKSSTQHFPSAPTVTAFALLAGTSAAAVIPIPISPTPGLADSAGPRKPHSKSVTGIELAMACILSILEISPAVRESAGSAS